MPHVLSGNFPEFMGDIRTLSRPCAQRYSASIHAQSGITTAHAVCCACECNAYTRGEHCMHFSKFIAVAMFAVGAMSVGSAAHAASLAPITSEAQSRAAPNAGSLVQPAQYRPWRRGWGPGYGYGPRRYGRCHAWRRECAHRWGWGGPGYRRCLWRHGC